MPKQANTMFWRIFVTDGHTEDEWNHGLLMPRVIEIAKSKLRLEIYSG